MTVESVCDPDLVLFYDSGQYRACFSGSGSAVTGRDRFPFQFDRGGLLVIEYGSHMDLFFLTGTFLDDIDSGSHKDSFSLTGTFLDEPVDDNTILESDFLDPLLVTLPFP